MKKHTPNKLVPSDIITDFYLLKSDQQKKVTREFQEFKNKAEIEKQKMKKEVNET